MSTTCTEPTIEYKHNDDPSNGRSTNEQWLFGLYHVRFPDGFNVMLPHTGWKGTISEDPLDIDDPEHRQVIIDSANKSRR